MLIGGLEHGFYDFTHIGNVIIPTVTHSYFSEGWLNHQPDKKPWPKAEKGFQVIDV